MNTDTINLKPGESVTVVAEGTLPPVEPPIDPPVEPPVEPPIEPPVEPPIDPPPVDPTDLYDVSFVDVFNMPLLASNTFYPNRIFRNVKAQGTSVAIRIPRVTKQTRLKITDVESTYPSSTYVRYGVLSDRRDFEAPFIDDHIWGLGGGVWMYVYPRDEGRIVYFNHQLGEESDRYAPYYITFQATFR